MRSITMVRALSSVGAVALLLAASIGVSAAAQAKAPTHTGAVIAAAPTMTQSPRYCDGLGDAAPADDCVKHRVVSKTSNGMLRGGSPYRLQVSTHPGLRDRSLIAEVQYRSVAASGKVGSWWGHRLVQLSDGKAKTDVHTITACAPTTPGTYQVRMAVKVPAARQGEFARPTGKVLDAPELSPRAGTASPSPSVSMSASPSAASSAAASPSPSRTSTPSATSTASSSTRPSSKPSSSASPTSTASAAAAKIARTANIVTSAPTQINVSAGSLSCAYSPDDEAITEYFNQIEFSEDIYAVVTDLNTSFAVNLSCPPQQSPDFPPSGFHLTMAAADGSQSVSCNSGTITLVKANMASLAFCQTLGQLCTFIFTLSNSQTGTIYSTTVVQITFTTGNNTVVPNLQPATVPICAQPLNPCALTGQCQVSTSKLGALSLCTSANGSCTPPPANNSYAYNENVYFQSSISQNTP